jgi:hypothetical protein
VRPASRRLCCLLLVLAGWAARVSGVDLSSAYPEQELRAWQPKYAATTEQVLQALMGQMLGQPPALTATERQRLAGVRLRFPLPAEQVGHEVTYRGDPLMFYSRLNPPEVVLPVLSLKFFSDVCLAYLWLEWNGYEMASPTIYMKLVKYNRPGRFAQGRYPPLLRAVGVPDDARKNHDLEERYYFVFNHLRTFLLLHELGHIYHRHAASGEDRQAQEIEADRFALEVLSRLGAPPLGAALYFTAAANLQLNRSDFASDATWKDYLSRLSHPANESRLRAAGDYVRQNAKAFADSAATPAEGASGVREFVDTMDALAKLVADPEFPMVPPKGALVDLAPLALHKREEHTKH